MIKRIALIGNPNVGKSSIFNILTKNNVHTGNWPGKTVGNKIGKYNYKSNEYIIYDLPGTYSLVSHSKEEDIAKSFIESDDYDIALVVCDATCLERNLNLVLQTLEINNNVIIAVNLMDEAKKKNIDVDLNKLSKTLNVPVIGTCAKNNVGIKNLLDTIESYEKKDKIKKNKMTIEKINNESSKIASDVVTYHDNNYNKKTRKIDKILTSRITGIPIMIIGLLIIFWITISLSNYPSDLLYKLFNTFGNYLFKFFNKLNINPIITSIIINGLYKTTTWVVSVMLPPMCIFFPIFAILEDYGVLPRIAFNLDKIFKKCNSCGKQALTMCMGFGCNAVGITSARIIDSKRERLIAIITNNFVPCNGRFPTIIAIISMFLIGYSSNNSFLGAVILTIVIMLGITMTFIVSKILSITILKGIPSSFSLELPPYRRPNFIKTIINTLYEKALKILIRAICVALPAGIIIWIFSNININGMSLFEIITQFLDPFGRAIGLDGVIILAFILGFPANEIVIPIMLMGYLQNNTISDYNNLSELKNILVTNGWTIKTALCTIIFSLMHFPCSTTCITIKKETNSFKWMFVSIIIPTLIGMIICFIINLLFIII
ncbi:MAG: ferrous iron transporter B [Bacilli bacterium]|nr:ferrous iron transporter B [Bacilli bacterium]